MPSILAGTSLVDSAPPTGSTRRWRSSPGTWRRRD